MIAIARRERYEREFFNRVVVCRACKRQAALLLDMGCFMFDSVNAGCAAFQMAVLCGGFDGSCHEILSILHQISISGLPLESGETHLKVQERFEMHRDIYNQLSHCIQALLHEVSISVCSEESGE